MAGTISPNRVAIFMALARNRKTFRTMDSLADELNISSRTSSRHLKALVNAGVIETSIEHTIPATFRIKVKPTREAVEYTRRLLIAAGEFGL